MNISENELVSNIILGVKQLIQYNDDLIKQNKQLLNDINKEKYELDILIRQFNFNLGIKLNFVNEILKKINCECPICYEPITIENFFYFGCHIEHIHCSNCVQYIQKCSLCNKDITESIDEQYKNLKEFNLNSIDNNNKYQKIKSFQKNNNNN
jgi:hypothetical protein